MVSNATKLIGQRNVDVSIKLILLYIVIIFLNCISTQNYLLGAIIGGLEIFTVVILLFKSNITAAVIMHIIFITSSFEAPLFVFGNENSNWIMYNYINMPLLSKWTSLFISVALIIYIILQYKWKIYIMKNHLCSKILIGYFFLLITGTLAIIGTILLNNNNIQILTGYRNTVIRQYRLFISLFLVLAILAILLENNGKFYIKLRKNLVNYFLALPIASLMTILSKMHGYYSTHSNILLMPFVSFFGIYLIAFPLYKTYKSSAYYIAAIILGCCMLYYNTPLLGKWILGIVFLGFGVMYKLLNRKKIVTIFILITVLLCITYIMLHFSGNDSFIYYKYRQALDAMNVFKPGWFLNLQKSPKYRICKCLDRIYS